MPTALAARSLAGSRSRRMSRVQAEPLPRALPRPIASSIDAAAVGLFALVSVQYFAAAIRLAGDAPFWMDEVLALWAARLPDAGAIWSALVRGAEFNPPLYDLFLHALMRLGVASPLGLRLPSILAIYLAAIAVGVIVRRRADLATAALAAGVVLGGGLFGYAVQARPYALVTAAFAWALVLHDRPAGAKIAPGRLVGIAALLVLAIGLSFYALLLAGALAGVELARARLDGRRPSAPVLAAIVLAAASIALWWPILAAARTASAGDVAAPAYYARPTLAALAHGYGVLLGWQAVPLTALLIAGIVAGERSARAPALMATGLLLGAIPLGIFAFALLVSHSYADRYALTGALGFALLFAAGVERLGASRAVPAALLGLALLVLDAAWRDPGEIGKTDRIDALAALDAVPGTLPIVTGSGLRFLELRENARPSIAERLVFIDTPTIASADPTNRHQVLRWAAIRPDLSVRDARAFLCATPAFLLFAQPHGGGADDLPRWLTMHARLAPLPGGPSVTLVRSSPCSKAFLR